MAHDGGSIFDIIAITYDIFISPFRMIIPLVSCSVYATTHMHKSVRTLAEP